jgi:hypothetical protein
LPELGIYVEHARAVWHGVLHFRRRNRDQNSPT